MKEGGRKCIPRKLSLTISSSVIRVLAQVQATIVKPRDDRPYEGFLLISSEIGSMASAAFENGR